MNDDFWEWRSSMREFEGAKDRGRRNSYILAALFVLVLIAIVAAILIFGTP
jgi:hypothetical protein